jgi:hypothetical protein
MKKPHFSKPLRFKSMHIHKKKCKPPKPAKKTNGLPKWKPVCLVGFQIVCDDMLAINRRVYGDRNSLR